MKTIKQVLLLVCLGLLVMCSKSESDFAKTEDMTRAAASDTEAHNIWDVEKPGGNHNEDAQYKRFTASYVFSKPLPFEFTLKYDRDLDPHVWLISSYGGDWNYMRESARVDYYPGRSDPDKIVVQIVFRALDLRDYPIDEPAPITLPDETMEVCVGIDTTNATARILSVFYRN